MDEILNKEPIIVGDRVYKHVLDDHVTESDLEKAKEELNESPEKRKHALIELRQMLAKETNLDSCTDDTFLLRFLRVRKFDCKEALKSIKNFYRFRLTHPKLFFPPTELERVIKDGITSLLPYRDAHGRAVFIHKIGRWNPNEISLHDFLCAMQVIGESLLDNPNSQINGYVMVFDFKDLSFVHFKEIVRLRTVMMALGLLQNYFPARCKVIPIVNSSHLFQMIYRAFYPFLKEKFRKRVIFTTCDEDLHHHLDPSILPEEYGGSLSNYNFEVLAQQALCKGNFFERDRAYGYIK